MYKQHFGLAENPFSIAPDPRYLYMDNRHQEALAHLLFGATADGCIILLTGEIGTGKTTICRRFLEELDTSTDVAIIINPKLTAVELLAAICHEFGIDYNEQPCSSRQLLVLLNEFLLARHAENRQALLIIDEAQHLDHDVLEMLRLLTNLETNRQKLLKIMLLGQSELAAKLSSPELRQFSQRITSRYHLQGLRRRDLAGYLQHRISVAGGGRTRFFTDRAIALIFRQTNGIPRLINNLCDRALLGAYSKGKHIITRRIVRQAAAELFRITNRRSRPRTHTLAAACAGILAVMIAAFLWLSPTVCSPTDTLPSNLTGLFPEIASRNDGMALEHLSFDDAPNAPPLLLIGQNGIFRAVIGQTTGSQQWSPSKRSSAHVLHP